LKQHAQIAHLQGLVRANQGGLKDTLGIHGVHRANIPGQGSRFGANNWQRGLSLRQKTLSQA
jgi:hypothetical protein